MKRQVVGLIGLLLVVGSCGGNQEEQIVRALKNYEIEQRDRVFSFLPGSNSYVSKFNLSSDEIEMVGNWYNFSYSEPKDGEKGIGREIAFLPNRVFIASDEISEKNSDGFMVPVRHLYKIGNWKIDQGTLMIAPREIFSRKALEKSGKYQKEKEISSGFYPIWTVALNKLAAVQAKAFSYEKISEYIRKSFHIDIKDFIRARYVIALRFDGGNDSLYRSDKMWSKFLMNPSIADEEYINNLIVMFSVGSVDDKHYDFSKNEFGLDFSNWK